MDVDISHGHVAEDERMRNGQKPPPPPSVCLIREQLQHLHGTGSHGNGSLGDAPGAGVAADGFHSKPLIRMCR